MKLVVSNMVCNRCVMVIENMLNNQGYSNYQVSIGNINLVEDISSTQRTSLKTALIELGFDLVEDRLEQIIQSIKARVVSYLDHLELGNTVTMSSYITQTVFYEYSYLSDLFSKAENKTIEQFFIELRIDRAKERLKYSNSSITAIAFELGFSSPQHFTNQFKQYTGLPPRSFRLIHRIK